MDCRLPARRSRFRRKCPGVGSVSRKIIEASESEVKELLSRRFDEMRLVLVVSSRDAAFDGISKRRRSEISSRVLLDRLIPKSPGARASGSAEAGTIAKNQDMCITSTPPSIRILHRGTPEADHAATERTPAMSMRRLPSNPQTQRETSVAISAAREFVSASMPWSNVRNDCACGRGISRHASASVSRSLRVSSPHCSTPVPIPGI
jgi:hypothetical protein